MEVMVVGRQAEQRWRLAAALGQRAGAAVAPDLATSRLSHPSVEPPEAVLLLVEGDHDVAWLHGHTTRSVRYWVPVVALVTTTALARAAGAAGAAAAVELEPDASDPTDACDASGVAERLRNALAEVTAPATVIRLDTVRTA